MMPISNKVIVIGGGLAGAEAAWQIAQHGNLVDLYEMRPLRSTGVHQTADLAELVCSNSLGTTLPDRASGVLKTEMRILGSMLLDCAILSAIPAGSALAVDRNLFSSKVTEKLLSHSKIDIIRHEITEIPQDPTIIATGPLTSPAFSRAIANLTGENHLFFYDAVAPIVVSDSVNMEIAFRASRYDKGSQEEGDYINCPLSKSQYEAFVNALVKAKRIPLKEVDSQVKTGVIAGQKQFFEGCLPIEVIAERGLKSLAFGPMRSIGLITPKTGRMAYATLQLRQDNLAGNLYNMVGFQTNLTYKEQKRVFRMIPGLEKAEFYRYGQMHRNTFIASPKLLLSTLQYRQRPDLFFAGQITGVEGYLGNIATGLLAGINISRYLKGKLPLELPKETMVGALCYYISHASMEDFQPMKANFGILSPLPENGHIGKQERNRRYAERSMALMEAFHSEILKRNGYAQF